MKINKVHSNKFKLLKLNLIKTKVYKKKHNNFIKIKDITSRLKKSLHVIYKYHINNKKILFIGTPINLNPEFKKILQNTKHLIIPKSLWMNGMITNKFSCFKYLSKNKKLINNRISKILFKIKNKSDLIVILNNSENRNIIEESYSARIPIVSIDCNLDITDFKPSYKVPGDFKFKKKKTRDTFFYSILTTILKKSQSKLKTKKNNNVSKKK